jgi:hypothetical protein
MLSLILAAALSAQADVHRSFVARGQLADVVAWVEANRSSLQSAMGATVLSIDTAAGTIRLIADTPKGRLDLVVTDRLQRATSTGGVPMATYTSRLVRCYSGGLASYAVDATLWKVSGGTAIDVRVRVDAPSVLRPGALNRAVAESIGRFQAAVFRRFP